MKSIPDSCGSSSVVPLRCGSGVGGGKVELAEAVEGTRSLSALAGGAVRASIRISCKSVAFHVFSLVPNPAWRVLVWTSCGFRVETSHLRT
jgi:hypothetical protein